ncbi:MAG: chromosome segregation protein SMC [Pseudomonadota bacterium]
MKFTKLRILGFKSFVEPTEFLIENGLTGVVGPNGCGKSNLVEAVKWAMGESSYKNMRASGMDDVIFSGSGNRPARNTAEVTLFLDNTDRSAPAAFNDSDTIEITRRIERESGSIYRINGREARARDVQLLFADASTGARSPSMVGQGRIGELISAKPRQRRQLLEEAAGISGLHTRRHEAELRLRAAEQNLDRVEDVVGQLEGQLENLKRQARQANRYRNLSGDIRKCEASLYLLRWRKAVEAESAAQEQLHEATKSVADATVNQGETARDQAVIANTLPALRDTAAKAGASLQHLKLTQASLEKEEEQTRQRLQELATRIEQLNQDSERERQLIGENETALKRLQEEEAALTEENEGSGSTQTEAEEKRAKAAERQKVSEEAYNQTNREIAELNATRTTLQNAVIASERQINQHSSDLQRVTQEVADLDERLSRDLFINAHRQALEDLTRETTAAEETVTKAEADVQETRRDHTAIKEKTTGLEKELGVLETEAKTLARVLNVGSDKDWARVIDDVTAEPGFEIALAAALGDDLDIAVEDAAPVHWKDVDVQDDDPKLPDGVQALADVVAGPSRIKRRLLQIGICEEEALDELSGLLKTGQILVTRDGAVRRWDGLSATSGAETPAAQRLAQKNRLADVEAAALDKMKQVDAHRALLESRSTDLKAAIDAEQSARAAYKQKLSAQNKARDELAKAESEVSRITERRKSVIERQVRITEELDRAKDALSRQKTELQQVPDSTALEDRRKAEEEKLNDDRKRLSDASAFCDTLKREAELRNRRLETISQEVKNWNDRAKRAGEQIAVLKVRREEAEEEKAALEDAPADFTRKRAALFTSLKAAEDTLSEANNALQEAENQLRTADEAAKAALSRLSDTREARVRAEERFESAKTRKTDIAREIAETLECAPPALPEMAGLKPGAAEPELSSVEARLDRLKAERERLGGVNLRADIEIEEITEKRDNLVTERDDLIGAIRELRSGIASLNKEGRERLLAAFDEVNDHFKRLFTHLFGGGTAELQLTESDDPLEAGLDILARPPGKKPQTMTLLSGGEQALTAMALIFAVFLTNPAPICVLDEVDAPLDDANVERFCNLLDDMKKSTDTRFLTITHNPITMARMNRLFGVTMAERGVSQLVSVDLETAESFREAV